MFILPGSIYGLKRVQSKFLLRDIIQNRQYLDRSTRELVVVTSCSKVFNIDFQEVAEHHVSRGAEITLIYKKTEVCCETKELFLDIGEDGRVTAMHDTASGTADCFMEAFIIDRELLLKIMDWYEAASYLDLMEIIMENISHLEVSGYEFKGYVGNAGNVQSYMRCNQDLLNPEVNHELFRSDSPIITKSTDNHPVKYWPNSNVKNCLVSSGCIIKGSVENSIIFRSVSIEENVVVRNCIIMPNTVIHRDAVLENVICDKNAVIRQGIKLYGNAEDPVLVGKGQDV
jgi:glucose-1-phosphate adenylyltransferase